MNFLYVKMIYNIFCKTYGVMYTLNLYMCIYDLFHMLVSL